MTARVFVSARDAEGRIMRGFADISAWEPLLPRDREVAPSFEVNAVLSIVIGHDNGSWVWLS